MKTVIFYFLQKSAGISPCFCVSRFCISYEDMSVVLSRWRDCWSFVNKSLVWSLWGSVVLGFLEASRWRAICESVYMVALTVCHFDSRDWIYCIASIIARNSPILLVHNGYFLLRNSSSPFLFTALYSIGQGLPTQEASIKMTDCFVMSIGSVKDYFIVMKFLFWVL